MKKFIFIIILAFGIAQYITSYSQAVAQNNKQVQIKDNDSLDNQALNQTSNLEQITNLEDTISYQKTLIIIILVIVTIVLIYFMLKLYSLRSLQRKLNIRLSQFNKEKQELENTINDLQVDDENFKNSINEINEGLIITDNQNNITFANNKVSELLNCPSNKVIGNNLFSVFDEDISIVIKKNLLELKNEIKTTFDIEFNHENYKHIINFSAKKIITENDSFSWVIVLIDVSKQKHAMEILSDSEEKFFNIINHSNAGIILVNSEGKIIEWNSGYTKITGYTKSEVINKYVWEVQSDLLSRKNSGENNYQHAKEYFNKIMVEGVLPEHSQTDLKIIKKNSEQLFINENIFTFELNNSKVLCAIVRDVSERKKIEEELEFNLNRFRELAELSPEAIFETDRKGLITYLNPIGYKKLGYEHSDTNINILGLDIFRPNDLTKLKKDLNQLIRYNNDIGIKEYTVLTKDKKEIPTLLHLQLIKNDSEIKGFRGMIFDISEHKKLENLIKENEEKYRSLFDYAPYGLSLTNLETSQILDLNQAICKRFNLNKEKTIGRTIKEAGLYFDKNAASKMQSELKLNGYFRNIVYSIEDHNRGEKSTFSSSGNIININDEPCLMIFTVDISDRIQYENELAINEKKYRTIFELTPGIVSLLDTKGNIIEISKRIQEYLGYKPKDIINKDFREVGFIDKSSLEKMEKNFAKRMLGKKIQPYEITLLHRDGSERNAILLAETHQGKDNLPNQEVVIIVDITDRKKIEEELKEKTHLLQSITDFAPMIISIHDLATTKMLWCNQRVIDELGFSTEQFSQMTFNDLIGRIDKNTIENYNGIESFANQLSQKGYYSSEFKIKDVNDNWKWFYNKCIPFKTKNDGTIEQILSVSTNIDHLKEIEEKLVVSKQELTEINRTKDKFFSIIAHDLKSPISSFLGLSQLLYDNYQNVKIEDLSDYLNELQKSARTLYNLMENLLNWARIQTGRIEFNPTEINLSEILDIGIEIFRERAKNKNLKIIKTVESDLVINADYNMIYSITRNLISNAIKFTADNGSIVISAKENDKEYEISVSDSGIGMTGDKINSLFKVDQLESTPDTENEQGTGMGLIICKEFIEYHHGRIWVESAINKGSVFAFTLPKKY